MRGFILTGALYHVLKDRLQSHLRMHKNPCVLFTSRSPGPADENKGSRPSLIALQTELLLLYGVRRSELVAPNSNSSSSGADWTVKKERCF